MMRTYLKHDHVINVYDVRIASLVRYPCWSVYRYNGTLTTLNNGRVNGSLNVTQRSAKP